MIHFDIAIFHSPEGIEEVIVGKDTGLYQKIIKHDLFDGYAEALEDAEQEHTDLFSLSVAVSRLRDTPWCNLHIEFDKSYTPHRLNDNRKC